MSSKSSVHFEEDAVRRRIDNVALGEIRTDVSVQPRVRLNPSVVQSYMDLMIEGADFPPVIVVHADDSYLLVDGYLRYEAAKMAGLPTLKCDVRRGDLRTAMLLSTEVNGQHGLQPTREDKRRSVFKLLKDAEWQQWSDREIARRCGVSHGMVGQLRWELTGKITSERKFTNKHGTVSNMNVTSITARRASVVQTNLSKSIVRAEPQNSPLPLAEVTSLSQHAKDFRAEFFHDLRQIEALLEALPPFAVIRDGYENLAIAARLSSIARKATAMADRFKGLGPI